MTIRAVNAAGTAPSGIEYHNEFGVLQTVDADVGYTVLTAAMTASIDGDSILLTDDIGYGSISYNKSVNIYVADNVRHDGTENGGGATLSACTQNGNNNAHLVGARISSGAAIGVFGSHVDNMRYVDCVNVSAGGLHCFQFASARNCIAYVKSTGNAFIFCNAQNCIALDLVGNSLYGFQSGINLENNMSFGASTPYFSTTSSVGKNMSSAADAPGADPFNNVTAGDVLASVTNGSADAHWVDQATAEGYLGNDLSADFIQDADRNERTLWTIGAFDFAGSGGGGSPGEITKDLASDPVYGLTRALA